MTKQRWLITLLVILSAAWAAGCREARMAAPAGLQKQAPEWAVKETRILGWDAPFNFGPYQVKDVHRGWQETTAWGFLGYENYGAKQSFEFQVQRTDGPAWQGNCATGVSQQVLEGMVGGGTLTWELTAKTNLACTFKEAGGQVWKLALAVAASRQAMAGYLSRPGGRVRLEGTHKLEGSSIPLSDPSGYVFSKGGSTVGAVQVINNGVVWLLPGDNQDALAAASAALLLYKDVSRKD